AGTRTRGTMSAPRAAARSVRTVARLQPVCSRSNTTKSAPASAARAVMPVVANSITIVPRAIPPSRNRRLTLFALMTSPLVGRSGGVSPEGAASPARPGSHGEALGHALAATGRGPQRPRETDLGRGVRPRRPNLGEYRP